MVCCMMGRPTICLYLVLCLASLSRQENAATTLMLTTSVSPGQPDGLTTSDTSTEETTISTSTVTTISTSTTATTTTPTPTTTTTPPGDSCCNDQCTCQEINWGPALSATCTSEYGTLTEIPVCDEIHIHQLTVVNQQIAKIGKDDLKYLVNLERLDLSGNEIDSIDTNAFQNQGKLNFLDLSGNLLEDNHFTNGMFASTFLTYLDLSQNKFQSIGDSFLESAPDLTTLKLDENEIQKIEDDGFKGLTDLLVLSVRKNRLDQVPTKALSILSSLASLNLDENPLVTLQKNAFSGLRSLTTLSLSSCSLSDSMDVVNVFIDAKNLTILQLVDNELTGIPANAIGGLEDTLRELYLDYNPMVTIEAKTFPFASLETLSLTHMPELVEIQEFAFGRFFLIKSIYLSECPKLATIHKNAFKPDLPNLQALHLQENALTTLDESMIVWSQLELLLTTGNPFHCDCDLLWFHYYLRGHPHFQNEVRCATPDNVKDRHIFEVEPQDFQCGWMCNGHPFNVTIVLVSCILILGIVVVVAVVVIATFNYNIRKRLMEQEVDMKPMTHTLVTLDNKNDDNPNRVAVGDKLQLVV